MKKSIEELTDSSISISAQSGKVTEAIILAGGLGTRLKEAVPNLPKCMAPVAGRPFLFYVINYLRSQGIEKFIFSLGYKHEAIEEYLRKYFETLMYDIVIEEEPLGTGGAVQLALTKASEENIIVTNGDTLFKVNLSAALHFYYENNAECTLMLKPMQNFERYGVVELNKEQQVSNFKEKQFYTAGTINGGLYILNRNKFIDKKFPAKFSFEKDYLEKYYSSKNIFGLVQDAYFIDIGIPEDYNRVQLELAQPKLQLDKIDTTWTLFLDRDGVINEDKVGGYILHKDEFKFLPGAPDFFKKLSEKFGHIFIATNQRGIGKQLMTEAHLTEIHDKMNEEIIRAGGKVDEIYFATSLKNDHPLRKPNPGMAHKAKLDFPLIDFSKSIMVGNKMSDMHFGKNAGMYTVYIATTNPEVPFPHSEIDLRFDLLQDFAKAL